MSTTSTLTMPFTETVAALNALAPHMSKDTVTPIICGLQITSEGTMQATDRYTVGRYKPKKGVWAGDEFGGATLPAEAVKWVAAMRPLKLAMGKHNAKDYVFRFTFDSSTQSVQIELGWGEFVTAEQSARFTLVAGNPPPVGRLFPDDGTTQFGTERPISLKMEFLTRIATATKWLGGIGNSDDCARFQFTKTDNPNKPGPVYVQVGERFDALVQPNLLLR